MIFICTVCPLAKHTKLPFTHSTHLSKHVCELLHCDLWGPYRVPTHNKKRFFVTIVDDFSRYTWIFLITSKAETVVVLKHFLKNVQNLFSTSVKTLRTDNGGEFFNTAVQSLLSDMGITHQSSCVYTHQQNGIAERKHRTILNMARALRFQASVPLKYWGECVSTAVYILNRLPSKVLAHKTPYEKLYLHPPSLSHLRVFGCLCYAASHTISDKFSSRAVPAVFMGYSSTQKGYILYDIHDQILFVNRHVVFQEHMFPFRDMYTSSNPIFLVIKLNSSCPDSPSPASEVLVNDRSIPKSSDTTASTESMSSVPSHEIVPVRKSTRSSRPPLWLQDFVTPPKSNACTYSLTNHVSYSSLSPSYRQLLQAYSFISEPTTFQEAVANPAWVEAMELEMAALQSNNTWSIVDLPFGKKPIGCK